MPMCFVEVNIYIYNLETLPTRIWMVIECIWISTRKHLSSKLTGEHMPILKDHKKKSFGQPIKKDGFSGETTMINIRAVFKTLRRSFILVGWEGDTHDTPLRIVIIQKYWYSIIQYTIWLFNIAMENHHF